MTQYCANYLAGLMLGCVVCSGRRLVESARKLALCLLCHGSSGTAVHSSLRDLAQICVAAAKPEPAKPRCPNSPKTSSPSLFVYALFPHHHQARHDHSTTTVTARCSDRSSLPSSYVVSHCCTCLTLSIVYGPRSLLYSSLRDLRNTTSALQSSSQSCQSISFSSSPPSYAFYFVT